jgi:hypothetical protein
MNLEERIKSFAALGEILRNSLNGMAGLYSEKLKILIDKQYKLNSWFTTENVRTALNTISLELTEENLIKWTKKYPELQEKRKSVKAGIIMAGNIPLAGFHDFLSVLISGNNLIAKTSTKDSELIVFVSNILCDVNQKFRDKIEFTEGTLSDFDVVIATGSDNSSRYFEYYLGKYPHIIRKQYRDYRRK